MEHPDWYPDWRHEAVHELQAKNRRLEEEFGISRWPRWDYDIHAGILTFSEGGVAKAIAEIQVVGTTSVSAGNWLWAWANDHWPDEGVTDSLRARSFGEEHGICELIHDYVADDGDLNGLGWELAAVTARVCGSAGVYRPPDENGALFLTYRSIGWAS
jgi:hypothetical protein